ncbi:hypothetical protein KI688_008392 [Linnemannia hyalina]|uniref:RING-type E3 ubiquitin transferase n=1 Tax=Linnemannia hyalina TaxID=64524 RepID=A0A9P7Y122_9FUNG|nr:hypothetical protein KI688_008392 [Linnemannia hyalina]
MTVITPSTNLNLCLIYDRTLDGQTQAMLQSHTESSADSMDLRNFEDVLGTARCGRRLQTNNLLLAVNKQLLRIEGANRISGFQQITPETFRIFPQRLDRLVPWIRRELQAITTLSSAPPEAPGSASASRSTDSPYEETDSGLEIIREYVIAVCKRYDLQTDQGQDLIRDFLLDHTEHFVHELMGFARSPFSMEAYDRAAQYNSPSTSSSTAAAMGTGGGGDIQRIINDEGSIDQERRERTRRRGHGSPHDSGRTRSGRNNSLEAGDSSTRDTPNKTVG